jgi:hypothetical protein
LTSDVIFLTLGARRSTAAGRVRKTPVISLAATTGLIGAITTGGGDPDQVLRSCGLSRRQGLEPGPPFNFDSQRSRFDRIFHEVVRDSIVHNRCPLAYTSALDSRLEPRANSSPCSVVS